MDKPVLLMILAEEHATKNLKKATCVRVRGLLDIVKVIFEIFRDFFHLSLPTWRPDLLYRYVPCACSLDNFCGGLVHAESACVYM